VYVRQRRLSDHHVYVHLCACLSLVHESFVPKIESISLSPAVWAP
jgi:hypothetical protein